MARLIEAKDGDFAFHDIDHGFGLLLGRQSTAGEVFTTLGQGEFGLGFPIAGTRCVILGFARQFLALGDVAGGVCSDFDQRVFHLLNDQAGDLLRVFRLVDHGVEVGVDDVTHAGKNTHVFVSC